MKIRKLFCLIAVSTLWMTCAATAVELYVATNGNDQWSGILPEPNSEGTDGPFATLERARDELYALKLIAPLTDGATVYIRGGTYTRTNVLELDMIDAGLSNAPIVYRAYADETPLLSGGQVITNFVPWNGQILQADVGAQGLTNIYFRQLFVNGVRQQLARFPNYNPDDPYHSGWSYVDGVLTDMYIDLPTDSLNTFKYRPGDVHTWARPQEAEVSIFPRFNWLNDIVAISNIDGAQHVITLSANARRAIRPGDRYFVRNVFEELDAPGEWYLDKQTWTLYLWPPCPIADSVVRVPVIDTFIAVNSTDIHIQGLTFECAEGTAIGLNASTNCIVAGCTIRNAGGAGIAVFGNGNGVMGNDIYLVGTEGIHIDGGARSNLISAFNYAENNYVHHIGVFAKGVAAIQLAGVGNRAGHNLVHDCPRWGVGMSGNNLIAEYNFIHHVNLETDDTGGIVTTDGDWLRSRGNKVRYNYIFDSQGFGFNSGQYGAPFYAWGIYMDTDAAAVDVIGNIVADCSRGAVMMNNGRDNLVANNILLNCGREQITYTGWRATDTEWVGYLPGMIAAYNSVTNEPAWQAMRGMNVSPADAVLPDGLIMASNQVRLNIIAFTNVSAELYGLSLVPLYANQWSSNIVYHYGQSVNVSTGFLQNVSFASWQGAGLDTHSMVTDPLFVDAANGDYRLQPGSPALAMGFAQIATNQFGLYSSPTRASWPVVTDLGGPTHELRISGPDVLVRVQSSIEHRYQLQRADSVSAAAWQNIGAPQTGTGDVLTFADRASASAPARYYRFQTCP